jgi:hypothetical protein
MSTKFGLEWIGVSTVVPATAMVLMGQPWMGVATIGSGFVAAVLIVLIRVRADRANEQALFASVSTAATFGSDPVALARALRAGEGYEVAEARGPDLHFRRGRY